MCGMVKIFPQLPRDSSANGERECQKRADHILGYAHARDEGIICDANSESRLQRP